MTSKTLLTLAACGVAAAVAALRPACAEGALGTPLTANYQRLNVRGKPAGVYEWAQEGLLFVHVRVPYVGSEAPEEMEAAELRETRRLLLAWILAQVRATTPDPPLAPGLGFVRRCVRAYRPDWGVVGEWRFTGETQAFTEECADERLYTTVCRKADVLKSVPQSFYAPAGADVWLRGVVEVVGEQYLARGDLPFVWRIGALDCLDVSRTAKASFPALDAADFAAALRTYLAATRETWQGVDSPSHAEYAALRTRLDDYLASSPTATQLLADARCIARPPTATRVRTLPGVVAARTNRVVSVVTNVVADVAVQTNESFVASCLADLKTLLGLADRVSARAVATVRREVVETETVTVVTTTRAPLEETETTFAGVPAFERHFLSGGCLPNKVRARTARGAAAEQAFFGEMGMDKRASALTAALRENPGDKALWNLRGRVFAAQGDGLGAVVCYRNALRLDRAYPYALTNLAEAYQALGYPKLATGMAMLAYGVAEDAWCRSHAKAVLTAEGR